MGTFHFSTVANPPPHEAKESGCHPPCKQSRRVSPDEGLREEEGAGEPDSLIQQSARGRYLFKVEADKISWCRDSAGLGCHQWVQRWVLQVRKCFILCQQSPILINYKFTSIFRFGPRRKTTTWQEMFKPRILELIDIYIAIPTV